MADQDSKKPPADAGKPAEDVVLVHARTEDGEGYRALRGRQGRIELAEIRAVKQGQPLSGGELVALRPRPEFPLLCDVEVLYSGEEREPTSLPSVTSHEGPARVSTRAYRDNWDRIFRAPRRKTPEPDAN